MCQVQPLRFEVRSVGPFPPSIARSIVTFSSFSVTTLLEWSRSLHVTSTDFKVEWPDPFKGDEEHGTSLFLESSLHGQILQSDSV